MFRLLKYFLLFQASLLTFLLLKLFFWDVPLLARVNPGRTAFMTLSNAPVETRWVPLSRISPHLARGVVAAEDALFYGHGGVDWKALEESWKKNAAEKEYVRGGSTITMQLAKNLYLAPAKNVVRKGLEILLAVKMNADLSKERVLEIYLNVIEWGNGIYGAEAAARHYFKKSAAELSAYEAAYLAAIIPSPVKWGQTPPGPYVRRRIGTLLSRMNSAPLPDLKKLIVPFGESSAIPAAVQPIKKTPAILHAKPGPLPGGVAAASPPAFSAPDPGPSEEETDALEPPPPDPKEFFLDDY